MRTFFLLCLYSFIKFFSESRKGPKTRQTGERSFGDQRRRVQERDLLEGNWKGGCWEGMRQAGWESGGVLEVIFWLLSASYQTVRELVSVWPMHMSFLWRLQMSYGHLLFLFYFISFSFSWILSEASGCRLVKRISSAINTKAGIIYSSVPTQYAVLLSNTHKKSFVYNEIHI